MSPVTRIAQRSNIHSLQYTLGRTSVRKAANRKADDLCLEFKSSFVKLCGGFALSQSFVLLE